VVAGTYSLSKQTWLCLDVFVLYLLLIKIIFLLVELNHLVNVEFIKIRIKVKNKEEDYLSLIVYFFVETHVEIHESVRSKDVFIIQTGSTK